MSQRQPQGRSQQAPLWRAFATTSPGLDGVLADELVALGHQRVQRGVAGAGFMATRAELERACLTLRTAHRVLWTLGDVDAGDADRLYASVRGLVKWDGFVPPDQTFAIRATARDNPSFRDARFVGMKAKDAIVDAVREARGERPSVDVADPDVQIRVAVSGRRGVVSLDLAGASLHERGYRSDAGEAPMRESVAAGVLAMAGLLEDEVVFDPCCGSGTLLIEAALIARRVAPGLVGRRYGFERWIGFNRERLERVKDELRAGTLAKLPGGERYLGTDWDGSVLTVARANAERARVSDDIRLMRADASTWTPPEGFARSGLIVTNPPWGERLGDRAAAERLLRAMGERWRQVLPGWRAAVLLGEWLEPQLLGLHESRVVRLESGGQDVQLVLGRVGR